MGVEDLVRLNVFSLYPADVFMVSSGRQEILGGHKPVSAYLAVSGLVCPEFLVEIDAVVCKVD
jgi:enamine deaminase RidA (YjgF/YER057c/UK114 family)